LTLATVRNGFETFEKPGNFHYRNKDNGLFFSSEAPGLVFSAPFSPSGRLYEPEAASHFKKAHRLSINKGYAKVSSPSPHTPGGMVLHSQLTRNQYVAIETWQLASLISLA
jgi:hypothetical protein